MATQDQANAFANNPSEFLKKNIVTWRGPAPPDYTATIPVALLDNNDGAGRRRTTVLGFKGPKVDVPRFFLRHAFAGNLNVPAGSPQFNAVWGGYVGGQGRTAHLPAAGGPNIMLTPELTGCTVACASNADGSAHFSHYNMMTGNNTLPVGDMQVIAAAELGAGVQTLSKEEYRAVGIHSQAVTVQCVGQRRNGRWEFWAQYRENKASGQQIRDVRQI